ncbi:MAG TPA: hypothetical protein DDX71_05850 [Ruminococcus sp.]|nr:hypothetical protein [Ruminococcus sp.]
MEDTGHLQILQNGMKIAGVAIFCLAAGFVIYWIIRKIIRTYATGDAANSRKTVTIVSKRTEVKRQKRNLPGQYTAKYRMEETVWHYVTFETEYGIRTEYSVSREQYDMLFEGDKGKLTANGSTFVKFEKEGWA